MKQLIEKIIGLLTKRTDYTLHYLCCFLIVAVLYNILSGCLFWWAALIYAAIITAVVGIERNSLTNTSEGSSSRRETSSPTEPESSPLLLRCSSDTLSDCYDRISENQC